MNNAQILQSIVASLRLYEGIETNEQRNSSV